MSHTHIDPDDPEDLSAVFYRDYYSRVFNEGGFVGWSYRKTHREVERGHNRPNLDILEIGAGKGEHLPFVEPTYASYTMLDLFPAPIEPPWAGDRRVTWHQGDACGVSLTDRSFDRVISMCVLHHLRDPAAALRNVRNWLRPGGVFTAFLPSDPGLLNRLNRQLFVAPRSRRLGFGDYEVFNAREHHNHYWGLRHEIAYAFRGFDIQRRYWPFRIPAADVSVFSIWNITKPGRP